MNVLTIDEREWWSQEHIVAVERCMRAELEIKRLNGVLDKIKKNSCFGGTAKELYDSAMEFINESLEEGGNAKH